MHVEIDNTAAIALYERHGFATHHTNRYLVGALRGGPASRPDRPSTVLTS